MSTPTAFTMLVVDDEKNVQNSLRRFFAHAPYQMLFADNGEDALSQLASTPVSLMLLDLKMPGMGGHEVLRLAMEKRPDLKVIMLTGHGGVRDAVEAIKLGAVDFFEKTISPDVLKKKTDQIHELWKLEQENRQLRDQLDTRFRFEGLIGESPAMVRLKNMITRIAPTDTSILIQGESGTGKELIAQAIHFHSLRNKEVFMPVDCASINETVMESELFGHAKGAFTGAGQDTLGLVRSADRGTLFLDEIGELSPAMQAKLLRTLQERIVRPVGSTKLIPVDIRILAATNRNLIEAVAQGNFRQDLYYRLSAVTLTAPPLRERGGDILLLSQYLAGRLAREGLTPKKFSEQSRSLLSSYDWPGNVRELENVIRSAMAFSEGEAVEPDDLFPDMTRPEGLTDPVHPRPAAMADYEAEAIRNALKQTSGSRREAARLLGISEATLYRRLKQYDL